MVNGDIIEIIQEFIWEQTWRTSERKGIYCIHNYRVSLKGGFKDQTNVTRNEIWYNTRNENGINMLI